MSGEPLHRVALFAHRWAADAPTGMGRSYHGLATGLAELLHGDAAPGGPGPRPPTAAGGWAVTATSAAEPDAGSALPAGLGWQPLGGPRRLRLGAWRAFGRPAIDGSLDGPDLVHSLHPFVPVPTSAPLVVTAMDTIPLDHPGWYRRFERWGFTGGYRQLTSAAAVVTASHEVAGRLRALGVQASRLAVVPLGIDDRFRVEPAVGAVVAAAARHGVEPGRYLVVVGQVSTRKNPLVVLEALASLPARGGVELLLVGPDAAGADDVRAAVDRLGLRERVRATGFLPDGELPLLLAGARALLHPSTEEGFGFTPLEAMAAGTAAAVAGEGSLPEVVGDAAVLLDAHDPLAWAGAIERLRDDDEHVGALVAAGRAWVAPRTWRSTAEGVVAVWQAVLDGRPLSPAPG